MRRIWVNVVLAFAAVLTLVSAVTNECSTSELPQAYIVAIDSSGSMRTSNRQTAARNAVRTFMTYLTNGVDYVNVIDFDSSAKCYGSCGWRRDSAYLSRTFYVDAYGGTNFDNALNLALSHAGNAYPGPAPISKTLLFLTDGAGTYTYCSNRYSAIYKLKQAGWRVFSIGLDVSSSTYINRLKDMATCTGGKYYADVDPSELQSVFTNIYQTSCSCGAGRYLTSSSATSCTNTQAGYYSPVNNNNRYACPSGRVSGAGYESCISCGSAGYAYSSSQCRSVAGAYGPHGTHSSFHWCSAGYYCPKDATGQTQCPANQISGGGAASCSACPAHSKSNSAHTACLCDAGYYMVNGACALTPAGSASADMSNSKITCSGSSYQPATGQAACLTCSPGSYTVGGTECKSCPAGGACIDGDRLDWCPAGKWSAAGATSCSSCPTGSTSLAHGSTCFAIPGYYGPVSTSLMTRCEVGYRCPGATSPVTAERFACAPGTYQSATGKSTCEACPVHTFASGTTSPQCENCPTGSIAVAGSTSCRACDPGYQPGSTNTCEQCAAGMWSPGAAVCSACPTHSHSKSDFTRCQADAGYFMEGKDVVHPCGAGYKCPTVGADTVRSPCLPGTYQDSATATSCIACSTISGSHYSDTTAADACKECPGGSPAVDGVKCASACPAGHVWVEGTANPTVCNACSGDTWSPGNFELTCAGCPPTVSVGSGNQSTCVAAPGYYKGPGTSGGDFELCPVGHTCAGGDTVDYNTPAVAEACPAGKYQALTGQTTCDSCDATDNTYSYIGASECSECGEGLVANGGHSGCVYCAAGTYETSPGVCESCPAGSKCDTGLPEPCTGDTYSGEGAADCLPCPAHSVGTDAHLVCSAIPGYHGIGTIDADINECGAGYFCRGGDRREACPIGDYQDSSIGSSCAHCVDLGDGYDRYTDAVGQGSCKTCDAGYFANAAHTDCLACAPGTYEDGMNGCVMCANDMAWSAEGSGSCATCPTGTIAHTDHTTCVVLPGYFLTDGGDPRQSADVQRCPLGHYCPEGGIKIPCAPGEYQDIEQQVDCKVCSGGNDYSGPGAPTCSECAIHHIANPAHDGCVPCGNGEQEAVEGTCSACPANKYAFIGTGCLDCPTGSVPSFDSHGCVTEPGYYTTDEQNYRGDDNGDAVNAVVPCSAGSACPGGNVRVGCNNGMYADTDRATTCKRCPVELYTPASGEHQTCDHCDPGYKPNDAGNACEPCPAGTYTDQSRLCAPCGFREYSAPGAAYCDPCPANTDDDNHITCVVRRGYYGTVVEGVADVTPCPKGSYCPAGATAPIPCEIDTYTDAEAMHTCFECPEGMVNNAAHTGCQSCPDGKYEHNTGECIDCPAGHFCVAGISKECPMGTAQPATGQATCPSCADSGGWTPSTGQTECPRCAEYLMPEVDGSSCRKCTADEFYVKESFTCAKCADLTGQNYCQKSSTITDFPVNILSSCDVDSYITSDGRVECKVCPPGATCDGTTEAFNLNASSGGFPWVTTLLVIGLVGGATGIVVFRIRSKAKGARLSEMVVI